MATRGKKKKGEASMATQEKVQPKEGFVKTASHGRMHYHEAGSGQPLILIHTNGGSVYQYAESLTSLSKHFRVILWEMPGHGDCDPLTRHYTISDYSRALAEFMTALGIKAAHISGCSCGGSITVGFASLFPERTLSAVIVETPYRSNEEWGARWGHTEANFGIPTQSKEEVGHRLNKVDDEVLTRWNIDRNKAGGKTMVSVMWAMRLFNLDAAVKKITSPAMVLYGAKGPTISLKERYAAAAPQMPIRTVPNAGHFPMIDDPEGFAQELIDFCSKAVQP
jgi:3-oxoadipate enol-lactonase